MWVLHMQGSWDGPGAGLGLTRVLSLSSSDAETHELRGRNALW